MADPMKLPTVLHVLPSFDTGGLGSLAMAMIEAWPEQARHIAIAPKYLRTKPDLFMPFVKALGAGHVMQLDRHAWEQAPAWIGRLQEGMLKMLRGAPIGNAIVYNFTDAGLSTQAIRRCGFRGRVACHVGTVLPDCDLTRTIARADLPMTFVPASAAVDVGIRALAGDNTKISPVIWNGVSLEKYAATRFHVLERTDSVVFGFSGRMANPPVKDWKMLFDAFRLAAIPGSQLRIAGDGPLISQLRELAKGLDVVFAGQLNTEQMIEFLHGLDVFVMAALPIEGFSMALVESIAAGCMILGTDVASVREVFHAGGEPNFLANNDRHLAALMRLFVLDVEQGGASIRRDNFQMVKRLQPRLDAKRMARSYWEIK